MRKFLGLALLLALLLPFGVQAQACPAQLSGDDCTLFQSGVSGLESIQSFTGTFDLSSSMNAMGMIDTSMTASGTIRAVVGPDGNLQAAEVYLPAASAQNGGFMGTGGTAQESALALIYADGNFYVGTGAANTPLESLTWQSTPATVPLGIRQGFPVNYFANSPALIAAWVREGTTSTPLGESTVFRASSSEQADAMQALAALGGAMTGTTGSADTSGLSSDMLGDMSGMFEGMTGTVENNASLGVTADGQPSGFSVAQSVNTDLTSLFGNLAGSEGGDAGTNALGDLGSFFGDSGMGYSVVNEYSVLFDSLNQPVSITAPATSTPLDSTQSSILTGFSVGGLFAVINSYFSQQTLQTMTGDPNSLLGDFGNTGDLGNLFGDTSTSTAARVNRGVIEPGQTINGTLEIGTSDVYTFTAPEATGVVIAMQSDFDTYLELENAGGEQIASNDDYDGFNSQIGPLALPGAGQYTIIARSFGDFSEGPYTLSLGFVEVTVGGGSIAYGDTVSAVRSPNQDDNYIFTGSAGDEVEILLVSEDYDTYLELHGPDGVVVAQDDDSAGNLDSLINTTLPTSGDYTIVARAFSESDAGSYTLTLTSSSVAAPAPTVAPALPTATPTLPPLPTKESSGDTTSPTPEPEATAASGEVRQWASSAEATSEYSSNGWDAGQATGEPDSLGCGDYSTSWASATSTEAASLTVMFDTPVIATEVNIHQTYTPGSIVSIELLLEGGDTLEVPDSADPVGNTECPGVFTIDVSGLSAEPVVGVTINVDQSIGGNWNEIDAVELVGTQP